MAAILKVPGRGWIQESYETGDPDIKRRAKELRARGYRVTTFSMGPQVTQYGTVKMTMVDIRPGTSGDSYLEQVNPGGRTRLMKRFAHGGSSSAQYKYKTESSRERYLKRLKETRKRNQDFRGSIESRLKDAYRFGFKEGEARSYHDEGLYRHHHEAWRKWLGVYAETTAVRRQLEDAHRAGYSEGAGRGNPRRGGRVVNLRGFTGTIVQKGNNDIEILGRGKR